MFPDALVSFAERRIMKNLSIASTVLMTVYTIFLILADLRLFFVSAAFGHMSKSVTGSKRDRRRTQCKCFCPDPYICSRLSVFLHCLCGTDCALLLAYPQKKIQSGCMDENCRFRFCIGGVS